MAFISYGRHVRGCRHGSFYFSEGLFTDYAPLPPQHRLLVFSSGVAEIVLGIGLCFEETRNLSIYAIILMLMVFLLVHFYMLSGEKASAGIPKWILILRIPLQFGLMYWAYYYVLP